MKIFLLSIIMYMYIYGHVNLGNTRVFQFQILLGIFSSIYFFFTMKMKILKIGFIIFLLSSFIPILYIVSCVYNNENIISNPILEYSIRNLLNFITAYTIIKVFKISNYETIFKVIISLVILELIISILRFCSPSFSNFINLFYFPTDSSFRFHSSHNYRLIGLGAYFFNGGILNSLSLILLTYFIKYKFKIKFLFLYLFILIFGMLMARTTIVGFIISIAYYMYNKNLVKKIKIIFLILFGSLFMILMNCFYIRSSNSKILKWGFEIFSGKSASLTELLEMQRIIPLNIKSYIIGDGLWNLENGGYYMSTDVGYLRILWCIGIFGILLFLLFQIYIYKLISKYFQDIKIKKISMFLFITILILNLKGYADLYKINYLLLCIAMLNYKIKCIKRRNFNESIA